jgi:hypothetical protein
MKASIFVRQWAVERWPESAMGEGDERGIELSLETGIDLASSEPTTDVDDE